MAFENLEIICHSTIQYNIKMIQSTVKFLLKKQFSSSARIFCSPFRPLQSRLITQQNRFNFSNQHDRQNAPYTKQEAFRQQTQRDLNAEYSEQQKLAFNQKNSQIGTALILLCIGGMAYWLYGFDLKERQEKNIFDKSVSGMVEFKDESSDQIKGEWTLLDTDGKPLSSSDLYGYYYLVLFGYINSPDCVPQTLYRLATTYRVIRNIPEGAMMKLKVIFISFDPDRDKPQMIKKYLSNFHKSFIGATGVSNNDPQLVNCLKSFKIVRKQILTPESRYPYTFTHSLAVYLLDSQGNYMDLLDPNDSPHQNAVTIVNKIIKTQDKMKLKSDVIYARQNQTKNLK